MAIELRMTGISVVGDMPWGTHFCHFYETKQDLLDTLVPYFKAGLESKEFCVWLVSTSKLITVEEARGALAQAIPDLDRHLSDENIEILNGFDWYLEENVFNLERVMSAWDAKLKRALALGYDGMRVSGDTLWLGEKDWKDFFTYEKQLNDSITNRPMTVLCTYPLAKSGAAEVLDVVQAHQFAIARRQGEWEIIETPELIQAKAEIRRLNEELEQRVIERTNELVAANEALKSEIDERRRVEEELLESAADLAEAQRVAKIGDWIFDLRTKKVTWSDELHRIFEIEKPDFDGRYESFVSRIHPDDQPQVLRTNAQTRIDGSPFDIEYRIITPNSQVKIIREVGYATQDEAGNVLRLFGTAQDITERKQAEDELRRQKEILQQIFDHIPVMINFVDADGRIKLVNREWERTLGWSLEEIRQQNLNIFAECYPDPQYRQEVLKFVAKAKGEWADFKTRVRDGRVMDTTWVRVHLSDGTSIGIGKDITERKRAEEAQREAEQKYRDIFENALEGIFQTSPDGRFVVANPALARMFGFGSTEELIRERADISKQHYVDPKRRDEFKRRLEEEGIVHHFEYEAYRKDGSRIWVSDNVRAVRDQNGKVLCYEGIANDITERKQAEEKLKQSERQLAEAQHLAHVGSWNWDLPSNVLSWSDELYRTFGVDPQAYEPAYERFVMEFVHEEDRALAVGAVERCLKTREPFSFYNRIFRPDGEERVIHARGDIVSDEHGNPIRMFGTAQDVTERQQAEERLRATTEQLRALSASLQSAREEEATRIAREIHDELGSALSSLRWDLEDVAKVISESGDLSQRQEPRKKIEDMMTLTDTTINTVRKIASELRPSVLDLGLAEAIEWQARQFQDRTKIIVHCDRTLENVDLSREQSTAVFRIFQETLTNILCHAQATRVNIQMKEEDGEFTLTISDNGRGITDDEKSGQRAIGLLGMRERAQLIGGKIDITGSDGKGTVVTVRIPISG